jgi:hypothetical protein
LTWDASFPRPSNAGNPLLIMHYTVLSKEDDAVLIDLQLTIYISRFTFHDSPPGNTNRPCIRPVLTKKLTVQTVLRALKRVVDKQDKKNKKNKKKSFF